MKSEVTIMRAVGSEFVRRKFVTLVLLFVGVSLLSLGISFWLTTVNIWWWLLVIPVFLSVLVGAIVCVFVDTAMKLIQPALSQEQKSATKAFVDKLERVTENVHTPMPMIIFRVAWDVVRHNKKTFIQSVTNDSGTLHRDLIELNKYFK